MKARLEYIKDITGNNHIGIIFNETIIYPFLDKLRDITTNADLFIKNKQKQDQLYYIDVISVYEYNKLSNVGIDEFINSLELVFDYEIDDIQLLGVGKSEKDTNVAYHIVVRSEKLQNIRNRYNLDEKDFYITIGFKYKDIYGVSKNKVLNTSTKFLKLIKELYYNNNETFEFIKELDNFEADVEKEICLIKIKETYIVLRSGEHDYFTVSLIDNNLRISAQWQDTKKIPIISNTLISKKLKEI